MRDAQLVHALAAAQLTDLPVRVRECKPAGMLASVAYVDLVGLELSVVEVEALRGLDAGALDQLAAVLDPRLQKASLQGLTEPSGGRRRPRR